MGSPELQQQLEALHRESGVQRACLNLHKFADADAKLNADGKTPCTAGLLIAERHPHE